MGFKCKNDGVFKTTKPFRQISFYLYKKATANSFDKGILVSASFSLSTFFPSFINFVPKTYAFVWFIAFTANNSSLLKYQTDITFSLSCSFLTTISV